MSKTFGAWDYNQEFLFPPSLQDFVPADHPAHFVRRIVAEELDLGEIMKEYGEERGYPPYSPKMMTAILLYGYMRSVYSTRKLSKACEERVDFMVVSGMNRPDHRPIAVFRKRHRRALEGLFVQIVKLCKKAGLVKLEHVAVDGTRVKANASMEKNKGYKEIKETEERMVSRWFDEAERIDDEEDAEFGEDKRGDEFPTAEEALMRIREAKKALEKEDPEEREARKKAEKEGKKPKDKAKKRTQPADAKQYNFTDPESGIMRTRTGFIQAYNAQIAVDTKNQVIVGCGISRQKNDLNELVPMLKQVRRNCGERIRELSADAGYCSAENHKALEKDRIRAFVAINPRLSQTSLIKKMKQRLLRGGRRSRFRLRKITVEPVFGIIKAVRGIELLMRGLKSVTTEWALACSAHNLWKLAALG